MPYDHDQIDNLDAELDELSSPTSFEVFEVVGPYDPSIIGASAVRRAINGGGGGAAVPFVGDDPPGSPGDGDLWWDTDDETEIGGSQTLPEVLEETSPDNPAGSATAIELKPGDSTGDTGAQTTVSGGDATDDIGGSVIVTGGAGADSGRGGDVTVKAGDPGPTGDGRHVTLRGSDAGGDGDGNGGNVVIQPGAGQGAGEYGTVQIRSGLGLDGGRFNITGDGDLDFFLGPRLLIVAHDDAGTSQLAFFDKAEANTPVDQPVVPLTTPDIQDVIDALVALGLVSQSD